MSDNAEWFYKTRVPEIAEQYNVSYKEAEAMIKENRHINPEVPASPTENVEIDLEDSLLLQLALQAHKENITLNKHINNIIRIQMPELEGDKQLLTEGK